MKFPRSRREGTVRFHATTGATGPEPTFTVLLPPVRSEFLNGLSGRAEIPRRYERDSCIRHHSSISKDTDGTWPYTVAPLTAYVYRRAIFNLGYCFAKRQTERTSYNRPTHQQPPPASALRPCSPSSGRFFCTIPYTSLHNPRVLCAPLSNAVASYRAATPTGERICVLHRAISADSFFFARGLASLSIDLGFSNVSLKRIYLPRLEGFSSSFAIRFNQVRLYQKYC